MPQMSPMNWMSLFLFFNIVFYMAVCKLYYFSTTVIHTSKDGVPMTVQFFNTQI